MDTPITLHAATKPADPAMASMRSRALSLYALPLNDLLFEAHTVHREHFDPNRVQRSTLLSIKTGGCPEDCGYCPQAARYHTGVENEELMALDDGASTPRAPRRPHGATRFCMGAAWRGPKARDLEPVLDMVREVKALGLETCCTLGMLKDGQAEQLRDAGLDYYNHNLDTAPEHYGVDHHARATTRIASTRSSRVRDAGHQGLLRRHRRHGRVARASAPDCSRSSRASIRSPSRCRSTTSCRSKARRSRGTRRAPVDRVRAHHRRGAHPHAEERGAPLGRPHAR